MSVSAPLLVDKRISRTYRYCAEPYLQTHDPLWLLRGPTPEGTWKIRMQTALPK